MSSQSAFQVGDQVRKEDVRSTGAVTTGGKVWTVVRVSEYIHPYTGAMETHYHLSSNGKGKGGYGYEAKSLVLT